MCYNDGPLFFSRSDFLYSRLSLLICPIFLHHDMFTLFCMGSEMESTKSNWLWIWIHLMASFYPSINSTTGLTMFLYDLLKQNKIYTFKIAT
jgi:hypothetical protein